MPEDGICEIKPEYVLPEQNRQIVLECVSSKDKAKLTAKTPEAEAEVQKAVENGEVKEPAEKKQRLSKAEKRKLKGQNKSRPTFKCDRRKELCNNLAQATDASSCQRKNCQFLHDVAEYLNIKPGDIGESCYNFRTSGKCGRGLACRFGKEHITADGRNVVDEDRFEKWKAAEPHTMNHLSQDVQAALRKRTYDFTPSQELIKYSDSLYRRPAATTEADSEASASVKTSGAVLNDDVIRLLDREKKKIDFEGKTILSPLTTVGNLPFRRVCKEFGADVTCGEMAMCSALLQGAPQEWALVKRHHTEDIFGVQLCANNPHLLTRCGQLLEKEANIDFIDLNLGCPIELVYKEGAGCGLLRRPRVLESCIRNLSQILTIPLTVKTRTGVYSSDNIAHIFVPKFKEWGASLVTVHGRSREQRYTRSADWTYIQKCAQAAAPFPVMGNGDILSYEDYRLAREACPDISGVVIGRGALIKPWIFTEIKEQKLWDISSSERLDILKKYTNYGLEHWGSDNKGVENTRRFMLEWLSFLYRYVPVGILEKPPQKINERPPYFRGRDDLETLMASPAASDWVKISEMLLGPVPQNFQFLPKHKANSYK